MRPHLINHSGGASLPYNKVLVRRLGIDMSTLVFILLFLSLLYLVRKTVTFHAVLKHRNHTEVFGYLSDVGAFQALNPTIINITHWERLNETMFYVEYTECLSQVPVVRNHAKAHYEIQDGGDGSHTLISRHSTCFFTDFLCLPTDSRLSVTKLSRSEVGYTEDIHYSCPWVLASFCFNEITFQRKRIVSKLKEIFSRTGKP